MKLALHGATGRMGRTIARLATEAADIELVGAATAENDPLLRRDLGELVGAGHLGVEVTDDVEAALLGADVAIDFSLPEATNRFVRAAVAARVPFVMGTTGLTEEQIASLDEAAKSVALVWSRNTSLGIQVLSELVSLAVKRLGAAFDVEIMDVHHRRKVDAPSGTALRLAEAVKAGRGETEPLLSRAGQVGARTLNEVGIFGLRGGDVVGDHTVFLLGPGERLELTHRATSRDLFAHGALRAARFVAAKPPGSYTIADVLSDG